MNKVQTIKIEIQTTKEEITSILVDGIEKISSDEIISISRGSQEEWLLVENIYKNHDLILLLTE